MIRRRIRNLRRRTTRAARRFVSPVIDRKFRVDQSDLQGNVLAGYGNRYRHGLYLFLRVNDAEKGRQLLAELAPDVTTAEPWGKRGRPAHTLNVAMTCEGLAALGIPKPLLDTFPAEFREGMAEEDRSKRLGDVGVSAPEFWQAGLGPHEPHVLLTVFTRERAELDRREEYLLERVGRDGGAVELCHEQRAHLLTHPGKPPVAREHFGFADGFAQPTIRGNAGPEDRRGGGVIGRFRRWRGLAPGEFVLGYLEEDGTVATRPSPPLLQSGTFTVVRKLYQDVFAFHRYLRQEAEVGPVDEEFIASRIVGRWRDGTAVDVSPSAPDPPLASDVGPYGDINDFLYGNDPEGLRCPLGAHVRRANPRDAFGWRGRLTHRHRIIRRSMPYGPRAADPARQDSTDRGLMFVCHQCSIERQFEVVQAQWMNDGDAFWLGNERDLLTMGGHGEGMTIAGRPPTFLRKPPHFVRTVGGGYFFTPGIRALRTIAAGGWI